MGSGGDAKATCCVGGFSAIDKCHCRAGGELLSVFPVVIYSGATGD